jgi:glyoxylase-like metal-dependent hydrolase (beta-lactamase superfamily II)
MATWQKGCIDFDQSQPHTFKKTYMWRSIMELCVNRRQLLQGSAAAAFVASMPRLARAQSVKLGDKEIVVLSDGNLSLPVGFLYPEIPKDQLEPLLVANGLPTAALEPPCNVTLLRDGDRLVIFDAGAGTNFQPTAGKLGESLAAAGIDPADVTDVVFTHAHPDHLWGLVDDLDELVFANAQHHMGQVEWDFWRAADTVEKMPDERKSFAVGARSRLVLLEDKIKLFKAGDEVLPGIEAVDTAGHTPGHMAFSIHAGSEALMVLGDSMSQSIVSFQKPDWHAGSDQDPAMGAKTRLALLDRLTADKMPFIGYHLPAPGKGMAEKDGAAYRFVAG